MNQRSFLTCFLFIIILLGSCGKPAVHEFNADFNDVHDRVWIGRDYWAVPMEDWQIQDGRLECVGTRNNMRVNLLTHVLHEREGGFSISVRMGLIESTDNVGSAGLKVGIFDSEDPEAKAACYFGEGIDAGIRTDSRLFIRKNMVNLPAKFNYKDFTLAFNAEHTENNYTLTLTATDSKGETSSVRSHVDNIQGLIALINHFTAPENPDKAPRFWFDDLHFAGSKVESRPENAFGPVLWSMYTLSKGTVKLTAQMPPLGYGDNQIVQLELKKENGWEQVDEQAFDPNARTANFRLSNWDARNEVPYRLIYQEIGKNGQNETYHYEGMIRKDPVERPLVFGGLTCQHGSGFPYTPLVENLAYRDPDILYFSGDQIYEGNGGYSIIRFPAEKAILSYLGKWYMFGWAFGDIMRDRPTICTPDDHDVFQGNLWGDGGENISWEKFQQYSGTSGGYVQPAKMVNVVHTTQCSHMPDPFDPSPAKQGMKVYYTDLVYGRVSFAIISDRMFKSGPNEVAFWEGRKDHITEALPDMSLIDRSDLKLAGDRQLKFLEHWITDWQGADMKVLLSQTVFANIASHHGGNQMVLFADLDSGGWPKSGRDRIIRLIRKAFAFHIVGDQHLPSLSQYGIDDFRDSG